jgi:hypothetical protein
VNFPLGKQGLHNNPPIVTRSGKICANTNSYHFTILLILYFLSTSQEKTLVKMEFGTFIAGLQCIREGQKVEFQGVLETFERIV